MKHTVTKRFLAGSLSLALLIGVLAGCGNSGNGSTTSTPDATETGVVDTEKEVNLKMYLLGDRAADFDLVYDQINAEMKEQINATVDVNFLSWAEHDQKYSLLFSSGEDFDMIFTASSWGHYETTATKKGFYELTEDFLNTYAPDIMEVVPDVAWEQAQINGSVYMVPNYNVEFGTNIITVRGDLMEKYGVDTIESMDDLFTYLDAVVENEQGMNAFGAQGQALQYPYLLEYSGLKEVGGTPLTLFGYHYEDPTDTEVISMVETEEFRNYARKMKELQEKGYWSKDSLSTQDTRSDAFLQGRAAAMVWNVGSCALYAEQANKENPDWNCTIFDINTDKPKQVNAYINNGVAINVASKNPERAMMAINQFMTNETIYKLAAYGIEGTHYEAVGEDEFSPLDSADRFPADGSCNWGWNNENLKLTQHLVDADPVRETQLDVTAAFEANIVDHPLVAFSFTEDKVKTECSVINTLITQYFTPIACGLVDDADAAVDEFLAKLKEAGLDKVKEEIQRQVDERFAQN